MVKLKCTPCLLFIFFCCCSPETPLNQNHELLIKGRAGESPIYRVEVPQHWAQIPPLDAHDLGDSKLPIFTFQIEENPHILINIHTFPALNPEKRIAPEAQIARWRSQLKIEQLEIEPFANGGFGGFRFEAVGQKDKKPLAVLGYAMQLNHSLFQALDQRAYILGADYTIKAIGPPEMMQSYRQEIDDFAESFELIESIRLSI